MWGSRISHVVVLLMAAAGVVVHGAIGDEQNLLFHNSLRSANQMPAVCFAWDSVMPPTVSSSSSQKWIVHRAETVYGLGDYLAGLMSAFFVAAQTGRRLYVDHPFGELVSFAPYDVPPSEDDWKYQRSFPVRENECPLWDEMIGTGADLETRVTVYEGRDRLEDGSIIPTNRACAWSWRHNVTRVWEALGGPTWDGDLERFLTMPNIVYGCVLTLFKPNKEIENMIPSLDEADTVIGVHVRSGDDSFSENVTHCVNEHNIQQARELMRVRRRIPGKVGFRIESDSACIRGFLANYISRASPTDIIAPLLAPPQHDIIEAGLGKQLAAWFALATTDLFVVSPMYAVISHDPEFEKYGHCPPQFFEILVKQDPGFADHSMLRLSSWSVMAALKAGTQRIHVLCAKAPPPGWDRLKHDFPYVEDDVPEYTCDTVIPSNVALVTDPERGFRHVNVHFMRPEEYESTKAGLHRLVWGIGNFM